MSDGDAQMVGPEQKPLSAMSAAWLMARLFLRLTLGRKRTLWLGLALLVPLGLTLFWRFFEGGSGMGFFLEMVINVVIQFFTLGLCLYLGVAAVRDEIEDRTIVYLFARPVQRTVILAGKMASVVFTVAVALLLLTCAIYFVALSSDGGAAIGQGLDQLVAALVAVALACLVYTGLFALFGVLFKRPMIPAIILGFGWEAGGSNLPGAFPQATLMYYVKSLLGLGPEAAGLLSVLLPALEPAGFLTSSLVLLGGAGLFFGAALFIGSKKQFDV